MRHVIAVASFSREVRLILFDWSQEEVAWEHWCVADRLAIAPDPCFPTRRSPTGSSTRRYASPSPKQVCVLHHQLPKPHFFFLCAQSASSSTGPSPRRC